MKFLSRFFKKTPPPTEAEVQMKKEHLFEAFRSNVSGRQMLKFLSQNNIDVELSPAMGKKQHGAYFTDQNKIYLNYNKSLLRSYSTLAHEIIHAVQDQQKMLYHDKKPTPYKALLVHRYSEAQAFAGGAKALYEYIKTLRQTAPEEAEKLMEQARDFDAPEQAYFEAKSAGKNPAEATLAAFDAFFSEAGECKNYSQDIGATCELSPDKYLNSDLKGTQNHYYISEEFLQKYGEIYFGEDDHHNIFEDVANASAINELYTQNIEGWVNENMRSVEFSLQMFYSNAQDLCDHHGSEKVNVEFDNCPNNTTSQLGHSTQAVNAFNKVRLNPAKFNIRHIATKKNAPQFSDPQSL